MYAYLFDPYFYVYDLWLTKIPEEGQRVEYLKHCEYNKQDENKECDI